MSDTRKVVVQSKQRLRSDDFTRQARLTDRTLIETISAITLGDSYRFAAEGVGGVLGGFTVKAIIGTLEVEVQPGIALVAVTPATATFDPPTQWIELGEPERIDLAVHVDVGSPRLVTIEIAALNTALVQELVAVFDQINGGFNNQFLDTVTTSTPVITARVGNAGADPEVPVGPGDDSGILPLCVVKLSAGLPNFTDASISILMCRPILSLSTLAVPRGRVEGGGFSVGTVNGTSIENTPNADLHDAQLELKGLLARGRGPAEFVGANVRTPDGTTLVDLMATPQALYVYAVEPPWAPDYGIIAARECIADNPLNLNRFSTPESVVLGDGSTFVSLAYANSVTFHALENMLVMADTVAPGGITFGFSGTGPARIDDRRGPHPTTEGGAMITLDATQDPSWGPLQEISDSVYLGSVASLGTAARLMGQSYRGRGEVQVIDKVDFGGTSRRPAWSASADTGVLDAFYPGRYPAMQVGDDELLPTFVSRVFVSGENSNNGAAGVARLIYKPAFGFGGGEPNPALGVAVAQWEGGELASGAQFGQLNVSLDRDQTGAAFIYATVGGGGAFRTILESYEDPMLASR